VPHKHRNRQPAVDLDPAVPAGPAAGEHLLRDVRRGDLDRQIRSGVEQSHRDAVRLTSEMPTTNAITSSHTLRRFTSSAAVLAAVTRLSTTLAASMII
jgi:hypothetical protein